VWERLIALNLDGRQRRAEQKKEDRVEGSRGGQGYLRSELFLQLGDSLPHLDDTWVLHSTVGCVLPLYDQYSDLADMSSSLRGLDQVAEREGRSDQGGTRRKLDVPLVRWTSRDL